MSNRPNGAMGSPYTSTENGEPSLTSLMGDAYDRLHENSWDGGKKMAKQKKEHQEKTDVINAEIDKKIAEKTEQVVTDVEKVVEEIEEVEPTEDVNNEPTEIFFTKDVKKEVIQIILENDFEINKVSNDKIIFTTDIGKFAILPI